MALTPHKKVQNAGSKGGKFYINSKGEVVYGEKPKGKDNQRSYDPKKDFKEQFPELSKFNELAKAKGLPEISAEDYKQLYQREHKAYMKHVKEAKSKGEDVKGFNEDRKKFWESQISADYFDGEKPSFTANNFEDALTGAEHQKVEPPTKEEYMKYYKQQYYQHQKNMKDWKEKEALKKSEDKAKQAEADKKKAEAEDKKKAKEEEEKKTIINDDLELDANKFPELSGSYKQNGWAWKIRYKMMKQSEKFNKNLDNLDDDEKKFLSGKLGSIFSNKNSSEWIDHEISKHKIDDYLKDGLDEKDTAKLNSILEKVNVKEEKKPEEQLENYKSKYLKDNGSISDRYKTELFPKIKGGTDKQNDTAEYYRNAFAMFESSSWFKEVQMMAGMTDKEQGAINKAFDNLWDNPSAKFWNMANKNNNSVDGLTSMLRDTLDNEAKVHFDAFIEKAKVGKAEADAEHKKKIKEEAKKKAEEDAKKKAEADAKKKAEEEAKKKAEEGAKNPEYQKEQVKKLQEYLKDDNILGKDLNDLVKSPEGLNTDTIENNVLGYKLTDWERQNLRTIIGSGGFLPMKLKDSLKTMMEAKINPENGLFNENIYDNHIRKSKKEMEEILDTQFDKDFISKALKETYMLHNKITPEMTDLFNDIQKNGGSSNSEIINYIHKTRKELNAYLDPLRAYNYTIGAGIGGGASFHKYTDAEKAEIKPFQNKYLALNELVNAMSSRMSGLGIETRIERWNKKNGSYSEFDYYKLLVKQSGIDTSNLTEETYNKAKQIEKDLKSKLVYTNQTPTSAFTNTGLIQATKSSKSKTLKPAIEKTNEFYSMTGASGLFKSSITLVNESANRAFVESGTSNLHSKQSYADASTYIHEAGHVLANQNMQTLGVASNLFYAGRTNNQKDYHLADVTNANYKQSEISRVDSFSDPYVGRNYYNGQDSRTLKSLASDCDNELISMGLQNLYDSPMQFLLRDPEHFAFSQAVLKGYIK
jgi:hypothetical protein